MGAHKVAQEEFSEFLDRLSKIEYRWSNEEKGGPNTMRSVMGDFIKKHGSNPDAFSRFTKVLMERHAKWDAERNMQEVERYSDAFDVLIWSLRESNKGVMSMIRKDVGKVEISKQIVAYLAATNDLLHGSEKTVKERLLQVREGSLDMGSMANVASRLYTAWAQSGFKDEIADKVCEVIKQLALRHKDLVYSLKIAEEQAKKEPFRIMKAD